MIKILILVILVTFRLNYHPSNELIAPFANPSSAAQQTARFIHFEELFDTDAFESDIYPFYKLVNSKSSLCCIKLPGNGENASFAAFYSADN